jgi:LuxR family transcriptional regulator, maltose regulon positive regulatory protein
VVAADELEYGSLETAERYLGLAAREAASVPTERSTVKADAQPMDAMQVHFNRALLELGRGRNTEALATLPESQRMLGLLVSPSPFVTVLRAMLVQTLVRLGDIEAAEQALAGSDAHERGRGELCTALAVLRLAQDNPSAATAALAPALDGSAPLVWPPWLAQAFLLEAIAQDALGDAAAAALALERALDLAEPDGVLWWFVLHPVPGLLERHARHGTAHGALVAEILSLLAGRTPAPPRTGPRPPLDPLSGSELRVLRYLPTNLSMRQIGGELYRQTASPPRRRASARPPKPDRGPAARAGHEDRSQEHPRSSRQVACRSLHGRADPARSRERARPGQG